MRTIEVLPEEWERQLIAFSASHRGGIVSLDVLEPTLPFQFPIHELPLVSVTAECDARESTITISVGHGNGQPFTHTVHSPTHVRIEKTNEGADVALRIESGEGTTSVLRFRTVAAPKIADRTLTTN
jgi:uncharacterized protein DUF5335